MRYIPKTRHGSLFLSALHETSSRHPVPASLADKVISDCEVHVNYLDNHPSAAFQTENGKIAALFCEWLQALHNGDTATAAQKEQEIDQSVEAHPFPYSETKAWFNSAARGDINMARQDYYRDWQNPKWGNNNSNFGVIDETVSEAARIGLIGDWGTGTEDARYLFKDMMRRGINSSGKQEIEAIIHLGDIYQAGSAFECAQNFLDPIEEIFEEENWDRVPILTIPGNHEYYLLGQGYFPLIDVLNHDLSGWKQEASYFCLRSSQGNWQFLGADTGLGCIAHPLEPGLEPSEVAWHQDKLNGFGGRTVFLTHHQFVSAYSALNSALDKDDDRKYYNKRLLSQMGASLSSIQLWLWGHDHWFLPYKGDLEIPCSDADHQSGSCQQGLVLQRGQLLGGSAREATSDQIISYKDCVGPAERKVHLKKTNRPYYNHTYGILDLQSAKVDYYQYPAWDGVNPNQAPPTSPIFSCSVNSAS